MFPLTPSTLRLRGGSCDDDDVKTLGYDEENDDDVEDCKKASINAQPKTFGRPDVDGDGSEVEEDTMLLSMMMMLMIVILNDDNDVQNCKTRTSINSQPKTFGRDNSGCGQQREACGDSSEEDSEL